MRYIFAVWLPISVAALAVGLPCEAGIVDVRVSDERGEPVANVVVFATPVAPAAARPRSAEKHTAVMDQKDLAFVPPLLVVSAGTEVRFPNSDTVSHHVYSFSQAKMFELGLYKGNVHPPVSFDQPGVVVIGCNIHDSMLAYIVVVPTDYYAMSDAQGGAQLAALPAGEYTVEVWTPRARPLGLPAAQRVTVGEGATHVDARISGRLAPELGHGHTAKSLLWDRY